MRRLLADAWTQHVLVEGWELAGTAPGRCERPDRLDELEWLPAAVPGTVAATLQRHDPGDARLADLDASDWWFRTAIDLPPAGRAEQDVLWLDGLATIAEVYLDGELVLESQSMFCPRGRELASGVAREELAICMRALAPRLQVRRRPRARWRTRLVSEPNLRFFRTMLIGRAPGLASGPPVVGPYRPVVLERRRQVVVSGLRLRAEAGDGVGTVSVSCELRALGPGTGVAAVTVTVAGPGAEAETHAELIIEQIGDGVTRASGRLVVADPQLWWPHTHGSPALYRVTLCVRGHGGQEVTIAAGRVGFRDLRVARELERDGLALSCNHTPLFVRGAVWTPWALDEDAEERLRAVLGQVVQAGLNMLRVPGIACYEQPLFYDLCDELGILVWQDFMFANLDYPEQTPDFMDQVGDEARAILDELGHRPSLAVLCGGSEVAQQVAMLGLDSDLASGPLFAGLLPGLVRDAAISAPYIPSTPWGGDLPFRPDRGVANYYGVGAYLRPLQDARRAEVKFAAECLAFSNVPDERALSEDGAAALGIAHPDWKRGVPRDAGAGWDFEDVRDHYLELLYRVDPVATRSVDPERYLELSRHVSGEVMAEVFGEWRREASPCAGGLVLWLCDLRPGAGWGLLDHRGRPKVAMHYVRRVCAPIAVWTSDEGLGGIVAHIANDRPAELVATLRVGLYRDGETLVGEAEHEVRLPAHGMQALGVEALLGRFVDVTWAYRFGPPAQDLVVVSLEQPTEGGVTLLSQSFAYPAGRPRERVGAPQLGLEAKMHAQDGDTPVLRVFSRQLAHGVRVDVPGFTPSDDAFSVEPGHTREIALRRDGGSSPALGTVTALNLHGVVTIHAVTRATADPDRLGASGTPADARRSATTRRLP